MNGYTQIHEPWSPWLTKLLGLEKLMEVFVATLLLEVAAVALTASGCWLAVKCHRRAGWYFAIFGSIASSFLFVLVTEGDLIFHPVLWPQSKTSPGVIFGNFMLSLGMTIIPGLIVVRQYRKRVSKNEKHEA